MLLALTGRRREGVSWSFLSPRRGRPLGDQSWPRASLPVPGVFSAGLLVTH